MKWKKGVNYVSRKLSIIFSQVFASKCIAVRVKLKMICEGAFLFDAYDFPSNIGMWKKIHTTTVWKLTKFFVKSNRRMSYNKEWFFRNYFNPYFRLVSTLLDLWLYLLPISVTPLLSNKVILHYLS